SAVCASRHQAGPFRFHLWHAGAGPRYLAFARRGDTAMVALPLNGPRATHPAVRPLPAAGNSQLILSRGCTVRADAGPRKASGRRRSLARPKRRRAAPRSGAPTGERGAGRDKGLRQGAHAAQRRSPQPGDALAERVAGLLAGAGGAGTRDLQQHDDQREQDATKHNLDEPHGSLPMPEFCLSCRLSRTAGRHAVPGGTRMQAGTDPAFVVVDNRSCPPQHGRAKKRCRDGTAMGEAAVDTTTRGSAGGEALFAAPVVTHQRRPDGAIVLRSARDLGRVPRSLGALLEHWAIAEPERVFLAERTADGSWRHLTYEAASRATNAVAQALIDRRLNLARPLMILAENGIDHALMMLGAMHVGVPVVPVSTAYARLSQDYGKLKYIFKLVEPGLIYVDEAERYAKALQAIGAGRVEVVASRGMLPGRRTTSFASFIDLRPTRAVDAAFARVGPETVAKILFTSGSTGQPKGVINTQGMMCANQESMAGAWTFLRRRPPVIVDWLPWNHTFGGNHNFNMMLRHGG